MEKSDRFVEPKVSTSSGETLSNASTCSGKSASHLPVFRTVDKRPPMGAARLSRKQARERGGRSWSVQHLPFS
ncbi:unnamed protein product [Timema podura]|uniref:Uncharacterized protein n=1 Tax=Timema podura TaxID=61482 RepID=A0ABN7NYZ0_TIMPD|nr:unnamed protein product [Timema podura]